VPATHIKDGRIVLNIDPQATNNLLIGDERIEFNTRFSGAPFEISIPVIAVLGVYARENGEGISFPPDMAADDKAEKDTEQAAPATAKPNLKIIK